MISIQYTNRLFCFSQKWLKMSYETEKTCLLAPQESRTPCSCHKYEIPGLGEDRYCKLNMSNNNKYTIIYNLKLKYVVLYCIVLQCFRNAELLQILWSGDVAVHALYYVTQEPGFSLLLATTVPWEWHWRHRQRVQVTCLWENVKNGSV